MRGMALFQEVPTVCGDTSCQGAPAFPGALSSADGFLKLRDRGDQGRRCQFLWGSKRAAEGRWECCGQLACCRLAGFLVS